MALKHLFSSPLTTRQLEVLLCVEAGDTNPEIARYLEISESSVKRCVSQLLKVSGARRRQDICTRLADLRWDEIGGGRSH
jgi:DNA-binding NarL/FixJ family response regulator